MLSDVLHGALLVYPSPWHSLRHAALRSDTLLTLCGHWQWRCLEYAASSITSGLQDLLRRHDMHSNVVNLCHITSTTPHASTLWAVWAASSPTPTPSTVPRDAITPSSRLQTGPAVQPQQQQRPPDAQQTHWLHSLQAPTAQQPHGPSITRGLCAQRHGAGQHRGQLHTGRLLSDHVLQAPRGTPARPAAAALISMFCGSSAVVCGC